MRDFGPHDLKITRLVLGPRLDATTKAVTPDFYAELDRDYAGFAGHVLIAEHAFSEPWPGWEMHPHGDEMVYLLSGDTDFVLWIDNAETVVRLSEPGHYVVVPKGVWHCARPHAPSRLLFVTPGEGTRHAASPDTL